jgi:hypothetical protein
MNINKINHNSSRNISKVKDILTKKKKQISIKYKTLNSIEIDDINNKSKNTLLNTLSKKINNKNILNHISNVLDNYKVEKKLPIPEIVNSTHDVIKNTEELRHKKQEFLILLTLD